jgi:hypothetical protein
LVQVIYAVIVNQVLAGNIDSLETVMVYRYELDSVVVRLEDAQRQNTVLAVMLVCLFVLSVLVVIYLVRRHREKMRSGDLANRLLKQQAAAMPYFTERVNSLSAKGIKLSGKLYEEFQAAIDDVKRLSKMGFVEIVNDVEFARKYPFLKDFPNLGVQEKIVLILVEEGFSTAEIALHLGIADNGVRAIKTKIRGKLKDSPQYGKYSKRLKILDAK